MRQTYRKAFEVRLGFVAYLILLLIVIPLDWVLAWVLAVITHELGHYIGLKIFSIGISRFIFGPAGITIETEVMTHGKELIVSGLGPFFSCLLLLCSDWIPKISVCAAVQFVYNLLPLGNNDGVRIIKSILMIIGVRSACIPVLNCLQWFTGLLLVVFAFLVSFCFKLGAIPLILAFIILLRTFPCKQRQQIVQ